MKTEYQKCMDGEFFTADSEMLQIVYRCKRLVRSLNGTDMENISERKKIIDELFGSVGNNVHIDIDFHCEYGINIHCGSDVIINMNCTFVDNNCINIGNNVLISTGAKVLGPFKVGDNSCIGANAVVLQEVPPDSTVVGIKARVVKIAGQRVGPSPAYALDQINLPDPLAQELCRLQNRVYANEQKLKKEEEREREADK